MLPLLPLLVVQASGILLPSEGCRYRKVFLKQASALFSSDPLEGWLTLDGKPCNPSSRFHWRPSVVAPTVSYAPVEVSRWAAAADMAVGSDRTHQKEFLKAKGLDVTEDEIGRALPSISTAPATTSTVSPVSENIPEGVLEGYSPGHISVNVTDADRFVQDAEMMQKIKEILANRTGLKADYFRINYTTLHDGDAVGDAVGGFLQVAAVPLDVVEAGITASIPESDEKAAAKWQSVKENDLYKAVQDAYKQMVHEDRLAVRYSPTPTDADTVAQVVSKLQATPRTATVPTTAAPTAAATSAPTTAPAETPFARAAPAAAVATAPAPAQAKPLATTAAPEISAPVAAAPAQAPVMREGSRSSKAAAPAAVTVKDLDKLHQLEKKLQEDQIAHERLTSTPEAPREIDKLNQKMEKLAEQLSAHTGEVQREISSTEIPKQADTEVEKLGDKLDSLTKQIQRISPTVSPPVTPVQRQINELNAKMDKLSDRISNVGAQSQAETTRPSSEVGAQIHKMNQKMDTLSNRIERVARKTKTLEDLNHAAATSAPTTAPAETPLARAAPAAAVATAPAPAQAKPLATTAAPEISAPVAAAPAQAPVMREGSRSSKAAAPAAVTVKDLDKLHQLEKKLQKDQVAHERLTSTPVPRVTDKVNQKMEKLAEQLSVAPAPAPALATAAVNTPVAHAAPAAAVAIAPAPAQAQPIATTAAPEISAPVAAAPAQAPVIGEESRSSQADAPAGVTVSDLDKLHRLEKKLQKDKAFSAKAVAEAQKPDKAFMNSRVAQVAKVELMDVKTDVQQEILTHALDGKAQMKGQVEAANHQRKEILQKLNVTMEKSLSKARASLDDAESQVAETARQVVKEVVKNVTEGFASGSRDVGTDADKLKLEAESLQNNISALLSHVERDSGLAAEIVAQLPDSQKVVSEVQKISADVKDIHAEAQEVEELAGKSLAAAETAMQVLNRSDVMAEEAKDLKLKAAKQVTANRAKILEILEIFGSKAL